MAEDSVPVALNERQRDVIRRCFQAGGLGSRSEYETILNTSQAVVAQVQEQFELGRVEGVDTVELGEATWRVVYDMLHATMYAMGPFELPIVVGSSLVEIADINLRICVDVWGAYGGLTWEERH